jgi:hypothetical protein
MTTLYFFAPLQISDIIIFIFWIRYQYCIWIQIVYFFVLQDTSSDLSSGLDSRLRVCYKAALRPQFLPRGHPPKVVFPASARIAP